MGPKGAWVLWSVSTLQGSASCTRGGQEHQPAPSLGWWPGANPPLSLPVCSGQDLSFLFLQCSCDVILACRWGLAGRVDRKPRWSLCGLLPIAHDTPCPHTQWGHPPHSSHPHPSQVHHALSWALDGPHTYTPARNACAQAHTISTHLCPIRH